MYCTLYTTLYNTFHFMPPSPSLMYVRHPSLTFSSPFHIYYLFFCLCLSLSLRPLSLCFFFLLRSSCLSLFLFPYNPFPTFSPRLISLISSSSLSPSIPLFILLFFFSCSHVSHMSPPPSRTRTYEYGCCGLMLPTPSLVPMSMGAVCLCPPLLYL